MAWESYKINRSVNLDEIYTVFTKEFEAGFNFSGEIHNFWECLYVISGDVCVSADERIYNLSDGDIIFHKPLELHKFYIKDSGPARLFIFSFSLDGTAKKSLKNLVCHLNEAQKNTIGSMIDYCLSKSRRMYSSKKDEYSSFSLMLQGSDSFGEMLSAYITQLILLLFEERNWDKTTLGRDAKLFKTVVDCMKNNLSSPLSINELSRRASISESSLKRIFSKYAGMGIHKYYIALKVKTATELLEAGLPVGEVSEKLGFCSQAYFSVFYKRETGKNPSEI